MFIGNGLRKLSLDGKNDDTQYFGEIKKISKLVDSTSIQLGNFLINDALYVYGGHLFISYNQKINTFTPWLESDIPFSFKLNTIFKQDNTYTFTDEELTMVLQKPIIINKNQIYNQFPKETANKYMVYLRIYVLFTHDIHHILISDSTKNICDGATYVAETNRLLANTYFLDNIYKYVSLRGMFSTEQTIIEEFATSYIFQHVISQTDIQSIHNILTQGLKKFIWNTDHLIDPIRSIIDSTSYKEYLQSAKKICEMSTQNTKYIIQVLLLKMGDLENWEEFLLEKVFPDSTIHNDVKKNCDLKKIDVSKCVDNQIISNEVRENILQYIYNINMQRLIQNYPTLIHTLYDGKPNTYLPPIFDLDDKLDYYSLFQNLISKIHQYELKKILSTE